MSMQDRINDGMKLLDREFPGWEKKIDLGTLNVNRFSSCVLAQLYGSYYEGIWTLFPSNTGFFSRDDMAVRYGFYPGGDWYDHTDEDVTFLWKESISSHLQQETV